MSDFVTSDLDYYGVTVPFVMRHHADLWALVPRPDRAILALRHPQRGSVGYGPQEVADILGAGVTPASVREAEARFLSLMLPVLTQRAADRAEMRRQNARLAYRRRRDAAAQ